MKDFIEKFTSGRFSLVFLAIFVVALYAVLTNGVMPLVMGVLKSDVFFEKEVEEEQLGKIEKLTPRMSHALTICKGAVKEEGKLPESAQFMDDKYEAWALGNRHYVIRSSVRTVDQEKGQVDRLFACKMRMVADDEANPQSWNIQGVEFNTSSE